MPLTMAETGVMKSIKKINGKDSTKRFLESLGFVEGEQVMIISEMSGNMIVNVKNARIAISRQMANRVMV